MCTKADTKVTTTNMTELNGSILIDQFAKNFRTDPLKNYIISVNIILNSVKTIIERSAEMLTNKLVHISEKYFVKFLPNSLSKIPSMVKII